eukprot:1061189-Pyramimonas_sp.AAC.1
MYRLMLAKPITSPPSPHVPRHPPSAGSGGYSKASVCLYYVIGFDVSIARSLQSCRQQGAAEQYFPLCRT